MMKKINLSILWHMHQPPYLDPFSRQNLLPWAFLHGMKDYHDMGATVMRHPRMRINVNFTPSLLDQLEGYADGRTVERTLQVMSRSPSELSETELEYLFRTCFGGTDIMASGLPAFVRLRNLYRAAVASGNRVPRLKPSEITDLTVLYLLSWCGPTLAATSTVKALIAKGHGFCPADRDLLIIEARKLIHSTKDLFRDLSQAGIVELSTTPGTHPILPLLCSTASAAEARADVVLPTSRFDSPDEARRQVETGLERFESFFGFRPAGMWPAEGSVSPQAVSIIESAGIRWIATDEAILARSSADVPTSPRRPWTYNGVSIFFRDHFLSDQIGFVYSRRPAEKAVQDFLDEMKARAATAQSEDELIVIALDGENAWEYYPDGGYPFLDKLYGAIVDSGFINPVTFSEYIDTFGPGKPLRRLATGSWIDGNFDTWIGEPTKNRAWDMLATARHAVSASDLQPMNRERVQAHLQRAEASDWFWWFGQGHSSIHEQEFDFLFRRNLRAVYEDAGLQPPACLDRPVSEESAGLPAKMPTAMISPAITGRRDSYYKWLGAGVCNFSHGSIHRLQPLVGAVRFGFDRESIFLAAERFSADNGFIPPGSTVRVVFESPRRLTLVLAFENSGRMSISASDSKGKVIDAQGVVAAAIDVLEVRIPQSLLFERDPHGVKAVSFFVEIESGGVDQERFPWDSSIEFCWDPRTFELQGWFV